jgi:hypothetical protein
MKSVAKTKPGTKRKSGTAVQKGRNATTLIRPLTASSLKDILWETLNDVKTEQMLPNRADAVAAQSREILRTIKTQMQIAGQSKRGLPQEIIDFSEK